MNSRWLGLFIFILAGCTPCSTEDFHRAAEEICRELVLEFKGVSRYEDLLEREERLEKKFQKLVGLMIAAKKTSAKKGGGLSTVKRIHIEELQQELMRIYQIKGGCEVVERAQRESLKRLEAFDRKR